MTCCKVKSRNSLFQTNFRKPNLITAKFYARHECYIDLDIMKRAVIFEEKILKHCKYERKMELMAPQTENQVYGWLEHLAKERELNRHRCII